MSDDLNDLKALMQEATPQPDAARRAENIALAEKNFDALQGSRDSTRQTSERSKTGVVSGVAKMFSNFLSSRAGMTASTALVAVGLVMITPLGDTLRLPGGLETRSKAAPDVSPTDLPAPVPEVAIIVEEPVIIEPDDNSVVEEYVFIEPDIAAEPALPQASVRSRSAAAGLAVEREAPIVLPQSNTEAFANAPANPVLVTAETPVSTFSVDVDTASYAIVRQSLTAGQLPAPDAVRVEEMINYFTYDHPAPTPGTAFEPTVTLSQTPWNPDTRLLEIAVQGDMPAVTDRPPLNLVFLIDTSGSMDHPDKLPLLKQSFRLMLGQLRPRDEVAIVTYAGSAGQVLAPTPAGERATILNALDRLGAGGSTAGQAGLQQAYETAAAMAQDGEVSRVILATDGDFNVGLSDTEALKTYISDKRDSGTYLSVLGFGRGNLDDATMQALAQNGNGQAAYIDTLSEAQKVLVDQLTGALFPIANDVKIQVEFNPGAIAEYRLIGYETRALRREDFNNDKVDAGDIGAGHQVTALYELTPVGSDAILNDPLRFSTATAPSTDTDELAFLRLRYKTPGSSDSQLIETPIRDTQNAPASFASAIAGFGQLLRGGTYLGEWSYGDAIALATATKGDDPYGSRAEAIQLMRLAQSLSGN